MSREFRNGLVMDSIYIDFDNVDEINVNDIVSMLSVKGYDTLVDSKEDSVDDERLITFKLVNSDLKGIGIFIVGNVVKSVAIGYEFFKNIMTDMSEFCLVVDGEKEDLRLHMDMSNDIFETNDTKDIIIYEKENCFRVKAYEIENGGRYIGVKVSAFLS